MKLDELTGGAVYVDTNVWYMHLRTDPAHQQTLTTCYVNLQEKKKTLPLSGTSHRLLDFSLCIDPSIRTLPNDRKLLG